MTASTVRLRAKASGQVFLIPALLAVISVFGLLSALLGDGLYDVLSWLALSVPVAVALWYWRPGRSPRRPDTDRGENSYSSR